MTVWGVIPAAGQGSRLQPLAFSKELLPVGSRREKDGAERPRAVSEYLIERMMHGGAERVCLIISPWKGDILQYYGGDIGGMPIAYVVQDQPAGLCDALFRARAVCGPDDELIVGLPDTIWFPSHALDQLPPGRLSFLLFPVARPELFDTVATDANGRVLNIQVKSPAASSCWIWGAFRVPARVLGSLHDLWLRRDRRDEYLGTLVNAWIAEGNEAWGVKAGESYVDVGTLNGYREAVSLLLNETPSVVSPVPSALRPVRPAA